MVVLKAPANRARGQRTLKATEEQAQILRKVGWTDVIEETQLTPDVMVSESVFPNETDRPKRKYTRRDKSNGDDTRPKRRYRRRDMQPEE